MRLEIWTGSIKPWWKPAVVRSTVRLRAAACVCVARVEIIALAALFLSVSHLPAAAWRVAQTPSPSSPHAQRVRVVRCRAAAAAAAAAAGRLLIKLRSGDVYTNRHACWLLSAPAAAGPSQPPRDPARPDQRRPYVLICARLSVISNQTCRRRRRRRPPQCYYSARGRAAEYCDARVCLCACKSKSE